MGETAKRCSELYQQLNVDHLQAVLMYHCCRLRRKALGSKGRCTLSSLLEHLEVELMKYFVSVKIARITAKTTPFLCPTATTEVESSSPGYTCLECPDILHRGVPSSHRHTRNGSEETLFAFSSIFNTLYSQILQNLVK